MPDSPRIWLANVEEAFAPRRPDDDCFFLPRIDATMPRFFWNAGPDDILIFSAPGSEAMAAYVGKTFGYGRPPRFYAPGNRANPFYLADAVLADVNLLEELRGLVAGKSFSLEPYLQTPHAARLADELGLSWAGTPRAVLEQGLVERLNSKVWFKIFASGQGLETIPGMVADSVPSVTAALRELSSRFPDRWILRRAHGGGGLGNVSGTNEELCFLLPDWWQGGQVLVEPELGFADTLGSLIEINDQGCRFGGIDRQLIENGGWSGFTYPFLESGLAEKVTILSQLVGEAVRDLGARGWLNLDWGVLRPFGQPPRPVVIEANFRHNGLSHILDLAKRYFGKPADRLSIEFCETQPTTCPDGDLDGILDRLRSVRIDEEPLLIESPGRSCGALPILPPRGGHVGIALFGASAAWLDRVRPLVRQALS